ncbi:RNA 2',3'-cyclic phosphodiesterase [bacterium]|nr:RNA 2',3'-cyclic phosphodiesterase [bacterium]
MSKIRCFCAVDISEDVKDRITDFRSQIKGNFDRVSWTKPAGMHITMKFLGEQEESGIDEISRALSEVCKSIYRFKIEFKALGFFPGPRKPRVVWVGVKSGEKELVNLNKLVEDKLSLFKIPKESRDFHPHITLGRIKQRRPGEDDIYKEMLLKYQDESFGFCIADRLCFLQSILKREGAEYKKLGNYEFI